MPSNLQPLKWCMAPWYLHTMKPCHTLHVCLTLVSDTFVPAEFIISKYAKSHGNFSTPRSSSEKQVPQHQRSTRRLPLLDQEGISCQLSFIFFDTSPLNILVCNYTNHAPFSRRSSRWNLGRRHGIPWACLFIQKAWWVRYSLKSTVWQYAKAAWETKKGLPGHPWTLYSLGLEYLLQSGSTQVDSGWRRIS